MFEKVGYNLKILIKGIRLVHEISPCLVLCKVTLSIIKGVSPFIEVSMMAMIINELMEQGDINRLLKLITFTLFFLFLIGLLIELLTMIITVREKIFDERHEIFLNNYSHKISFDKIENGSTTELRDMIKGIMDMEGGGLKAVSSLLGDLCKNITIVGVSGILCFYIIKHFLWLSILFIMIIWGLTSVKLFLAAKMKYQIFNATLNGVKYNKYLSYYLYEYLEDDKFAKDIRIFNQHELVKREMEEKGFDSWIGIFNTCAKVKKKFGGLSCVISVIISGVIYFFVVIHALMKKIGIGDVVKYFTVFTEFMNGLEGIVETINAIKYNNKYLKLVYKYIDLDQKLEDMNGKECLKEESVKEIAFHNVSYKYPGSNTYALENVSFKINSNEHVAIVGMNGSGKTTMIKLLCRFYKPDKGSITVNGKDIQEFPYNEYRKMFSVVFQDFALFAFPIGENIAVDFNYDVDKVWDILEQAGIKQCVEKLKCQLNTVLYKQYEESGVDLSGGEEQKIAISRALYRNAQIYILDEPTAALDPVSEAEIYSKMETMTNKKTVIFISHRLSSCCKSDKIIVFHKGKIVQQGTHKELLKNTRGRYYKLWNSQAECYQNN